MVNDNRRGKPYIQEVKLASMTGGLTGLCDRRCNYNIILEEQNLYHSSYLFLYNDNRRHQCVILYIRRLNLILLYSSSNLVFYWFSLCDQHVHVSPAASAIVYCRMLLFISTICAFYQSGLNVKCSTCAN